MHKMLNKLEKNMLAPIIVLNFLRKREKIKKIGGGGTPRGHYNVAIILTNSRSCVV